MRYTDALAAIQNSDLANKDEVLSAISDEKSGLVGEIRTERQKKNAAIETAESLVGLVQVEGESFEDQAKNAKSKVKTLIEQAAGWETEKADLTKERDDLKTAIARRDRTENLRTAADAAGANPTVLVRLIGDSEVPIAVNEKKEVEVEVDGKKVPLREYAETNYSEFMAVLFPDEKSARRLPTGKSQDGAKPQTPFDLMNKNRYPGPKGLKKTS